MEPPSVPKTPLQWFGWTDRGRIRPNNEDSFLCLQFDAQEVRHLGRIGGSGVDQADLVFAVSDGMGGANAGEFASRVTVEKIMRRLPPAYRQAAVGLQAGFDDVLTELFHDIHRALTFLGGSYEECAGMGATLTLCWVRPGWIYHAHIGDSRLYYLPAGGGVKRLTEDDTHVGWLYRNGKINEREARGHPGRSSLQKALGAGHQFVDPQLGAVAYEPGDQFLLCTDGLVDGLYDATIEEIARAGGGGNPAQTLVDAAVEASGRDNTTALLLRVADEIAPAVGSVAG